jgi:hypothetical protein
LAEQWFQSQGIVNLLVKQLAPDKPDSHDPVLNVLQGIIDIQFSDPQSLSLLYGQLHEQENLNQILSYIFEEGFSSSILHGVPVIVGILRTDFKETNYSSTTDLPPVIKSIIGYLSDLNKALQTPPEVTHISHIIPLTVIMEYLRGFLNRQVEALLH